MSALRSGTMILGVSALGSFVNYLFQFIMSRSLGLDGFGAMNALFAMIVVAGMPAATVMLVLARHVAGFKVDGRDERIASLYRQSLLKMALLGAAVFALFYAFSQELASYLGLASPRPVVVMGAGLLLAFPMTVNLGMLKGLRKFHLFGAGVGLVSMTKLLFGAALVASGWGLSGAVGAVAASAFTVFTLTAMPLAKYLFMKGDRGKAASDLFFYSIPALASTIVFAAFTNIDIVMVRHYFTPEESGLYAAAAIIGKTVLYVSASMTSALFPAVWDAHSSNTDPFRLLERALLCILALAALAIACFIAAPGLVIGAFFGPAFGPASSLLWLYGAAAAMSSVTSLLVTFNLARNRTGFIYSLGAAAVILPLLIALGHSSLAAVVLAVAAVNLCLMALNLWTVMRERSVAVFRFEAARR